MDTDRKKRYGEKFELIYERTEDVELLLPNLNDKIKRLACYKAFQELVESLFDITAMMLKDNNKVVQDDYTNVDKLHNIGIVNEKDIKILQESNGLRNRIVHRYNKTDDNIAKDSMVTLLPGLKAITEKLHKNVK